MVLNIALRQAKLSFYANELKLTMIEYGVPKQAWTIINIILGQNNQQHDTIGKIKRDGTKRYF